MSMYENMKEDVDEACELVLSFVVRSQLYPAYVNSNHAHTTAQLAPTQCQRMPTSEEARLK